MNDVLKYFRTYHLPYSPGTTNDDKKLVDDSDFVGKEVVITAKMDGENCLDENTIISTNIGDISIKEICNKKMTVEVLSYNIDLDKLENKKIMDYQVMSSGDDWYEIELENGSILKLTGNHYIYLPELHIYRRVDELIIGDELLYLPSN
ncbi:MAG: hypothetical protein M0R17_03800 [Candidatus Omnitrophica bacterium]|jgi:intein/homing endonuclease|nr:hypothetical protein [Candidatus Omnitrophota bacterium]